MRAPFQEGEFPGPVKYGYTSVGRVEEGPDSTPHDLMGRLVFCLYPHQDLYCVPAAAVTPIPDAVPAGRAVLAANMETAVNVLWDARPAAGDRIFVIGAGVVGLLVAWLCCQIPGACVTVVDTNPMRESIARELGVPFLAEPPARRECRPGRARERPAGRVDERAGHCGHRSHHRRGELVWEPARVPSSWRGVSTRAA